MYGAGGVGIVVEAFTDNLNRAAANIRDAVKKAGGKMADPGSVLFNFERRVSRDDAFEIRQDLRTESSGFLNFDWRVNHEKHLRTTAGVNANQVCSNLERRVKSRVKHLGSEAMNFHSFCLLQMMGKQRKASKPSKR